MNIENDSAREPTLYLIPYLDEDFDLNVMDALRERGYEVYSARDEGFTTAKLGRTISDAEQLAYAVSRAWTVVTFNRGDFANLHIEYLTKGWEHNGIVVSLQVETGRAVRALLNLLDKVSVDEARNQLLYLQNFE
ncbi:MAG: hypothetical protein B6D41_00045 [Chloroflexi bacterium UTCFX4]|jgi:hypothetical protein|nr:MAG: hypothetical protein B6D41_00045 [Chloroflexi bacterium UTCFX4]